MTVRAKLKDLAPGTVFNAGPIDVRVLEHFTDKRTLLIADTCIADRHFADQPFKTRPEKPAANPNDWRFSNLNRELNTEFLATFDQAEGPIRSKDILTADWSLADHEGGEGYGTIQAKIALLTQAMYGKYADQGGVRPAFFVESGITLSLEPDQVELSTSALLAEFTSKQLVEEVLRRIAEGQEDGDDNEEDDF